MLLALRLAPPAWALLPFTRADAVNPILTPGSGVFECPIRRELVHWEADNVFNPAAVVYRGKIELVYRAEDKSGEGIGNHCSRLGLAKSSDGLHFRREPVPVFYPALDSIRRLEWPGGCEDPRIVEAPDGRFVMTYTMWDRKTARIGVATSRDLHHWKKIGCVFEGTPYRDVWSKSGSIVCERQGDQMVARKVDGRYWMYWGDTDMFIATSPDLIHWKPAETGAAHRAVVLKRRLGKFDSSVCEPGPPALWTKHGIVLIYNGRSDRNGDPDLAEGTYAAGEALFDGKNPSKVIGRLDTYFMKPQRSYEVSGQYAAGCVFAEGLAHFKNRWFLYYGSSDSRISVATLKL
ncbi:MAG TPA: glycoside hydrolase family 130 protein [Fimbriimonadaceae bacterium]|nr:glycoside hydrolase family 130 protein [Fimbriimonadaceae bacterium]